MSSYIRLQESNCKNCLRCVRVCPTKAMAYVNYQPQIIEDECILCGKCFVICPHSAKKIKSDLNQVNQWINNKQKVIATVAPSFIGVWSSFNELKSKLIEKGFYDVIETSFAASKVSEHYNYLIAENKMNNIISTCCPVVVDLIEKEYPELIEALASIVSPMIASGVLIKEQHPDAKVVFINPCIAKKREIKDIRNNGIIDATIEMDELEYYLKDVHVDYKDNLDSFDGDIARIYPTPSGILKTLNSKDSNYETFSVEGISRIRLALEAIKNKEIEKCFIEMSACKESCLGGPILENHYHKKWASETKLKRQIHNSSVIKNMNNLPAFKAKWQSQLKTKQSFSEAQIQDMLYILGKTNENQVLNCGSCGYETCKEKAIAVLENKADPNLCIPDALEMALSTSNLVIKNTPNGIIVIDSKLQIETINPAAKAMFRLESTNCNEMPIQAIIQCSELEYAINHPQKIQYFKYYYDEYKILVNHCVIYLKEHHKFIIILMDLTIEETKEKIIRKYRENTLEITQKIIDDQMRTVQEVASLLGESTANSKIALSKLMKAIEKDE